MRLQGFCERIQVEVPPKMQEESRKGREKVARTEVAVGIFSIVDIGRANEITR